MRNKTAIPFVGTGMTNTESSAQWTRTASGDHVWESPKGTVTVRKVGAFWFSRKPGDRVDNFNPKADTPQRRGGSNTARDAKANAERRMFLGD
jgi:hypothetical protein